MRANVTSISLHVPYSKRAFLCTSKMNMVWTLNMTQHIRIGVGHTHNPYFWSSWCAWAVVKKYIFICIEITFQILTRLNIKWCNIILVGVLKCFDLKKIGVGVPYMYLWVIFFNRTLLIIGIALNIWWNDRGGDYNVLMKFEVFILESTCVHCWGFLLVPWLSSNWSIKWLIFKGAYFLQT